MRVVIIYLSLALSIILATAKPNLQNDQNKTVSVINESAGDLIIEPPDGCSPFPCGENAECKDHGNYGTCSCPTGMYGDPYEHCKPLVERPAAEILPPSPCTPSLCGPNSFCREVNDQAVCSCLSGYIGSPPACKPECVQNSDCSNASACLNLRCRDPCPSACGLDAKCTVIDHIPTCSCLPCMTGDPFLRCFPTPTCTVPCVVNSDCPGHQACIDQHCEDPCKGICGSGATCFVKNHTAACHCSPGFAGNPFQKCNFIGEEVKNPCSPSPCGENSTCSPDDKTAVCTCLAGYIGDPFVSCKPKHKPAVGCIKDRDCHDNLACFNGDCRDPCVGTCGDNAKCVVNAHRAICECPEGTTGDPFVECIEIGDDPDQRCSISPCGPNSQCRVVNGTSVLCSCLPNFIGLPPACKPECILNSDCANNEGCVNYRCKDACDGVCGNGAQCVVKDHRPICSCPKHTVGDPFVGCNDFVVDYVDEVSCSPGFCGANSICRDKSGTANCFCLPGYYGDPYTFCKLLRITDDVECSKNSDCTDDLACIDERCRDPCPGACGRNAVCAVEKHNPVCSCPRKFTGNPLVNCTDIPEHQ